MSHRMPFMPSPEVAATVVATTGAGVSFAAGFIATYSESHDLTAALTAGAQIAAGCVAIVGGRPRVGTAIYSINLAECAHGYEEERDDDQG